LINWLGRGKRFSSGEIHLTIVAYDIITSLFSTFEGFLSYPPERIVAIMRGVPQERAVWESENVKNAKKFEKMYFWRSAKALRGRNAERFRINLPGA
jgi:hypothetical protein